MENETKTVTETQTAYCVQPAGFDRRLDHAAGRLFFDRDAAEAYASTLEPDYLYVEVLAVLPA